MAQIHLESKQESEYIAQLEAIIEELERRKKDQECFEYVQEQKRLAYERKYVICPICKADLSTYGKRLQYCNKCGYEREV